MSDTVAATVEYRTRSDGIGRMSVALPDWFGVSRPRQKAFYKLLAQHVGEFWNAMTVQLIRETLAAAIAEAQRDAEMYERGEYRGHFRKADDRPPNRLTRLLTIQKDFEETMDKHTPKR